MSTLYNNNDINNAFIGKYLVWGKRYLGKCVSVEGDKHLGYSLSCEESDSPKHILLLYIGSNWDLSAIVNIIKSFDSRDSAILYTEMID